MSKTIKNISGLRFGKLTVLEQTNERINGAVVWKCNCDCGNTVLVSSRHLTSGNTLSCGCSRINNLVGQTFGRLKVISDSGERSLSRGVIWTCQCTCGNTVNVIGQSLTSMLTKSCGCLNKETHTTHGMYNTVTYKTWISMKERCYNPNVENYYNYGGRGITICDRWLNSFENFYADMGERPDGMTIDRIDTNGHYEPSNCKWSTSEEQQNNRRDNVTVIYNNQEYNATLLAREHNIPPHVFIGRLRNNWSVEDALITPVRERIVL